MEPSAVTDAKLAFLSANAVQDHDPDLLAERLRSVIPVTDFAQIGGRHGFSHRSVVTRAGDIHVIAGAHTPLFGSVSESNLATILLPLQGLSTFWIDGQVLEARGGGNALYLPGHSYRGQTEAYNGALFSIHPHTLAETAAVIAGQPAEETITYQSRLETPQQFDRQDRRQGELIANLEQTLRLLELQTINGPELATLLRLDDVIRRCLVLLLLPELLEAPVPSVSAQGKNRQRLEALESFIHQHLRSPISLTDLEAHSGLSRRSLQHAFQQRHGCGPMQWLRRQRLVHARDRLLHPQPGDSVASVAMVFRYPNLSAFSRDFRDVFTMRPSDLLRQGQRLAAASGLAMQQNDVDRPETQGH
ncbi:MAG: helix-turn-helix domain-containing protein [Cyanobacteriota bacterium]